MKEKVVDKMQNIMKSKAFPVICAISASAGTMLPVFAADANAKTIVAKAIGTIVTIFQYIGIVLAVWALGQLFLAFKNEDADSKSRAIMTLMASIVLIAMKTIVKGIISAAGVGITWQDGWL